MSIFKKILYLHLICAVIVAMPVQAYFFNVQEWVNGTQKLFLFSDHHVETVPMAQRIELLNAAKRMNAYVIAEDHLEPKGVADLDQAAWAKLKTGTDFTAAVESAAIKPFLAAIYKDCYEKNVQGCFRGNINYDPNTDYSHLLPENFIAMANKRVNPLAGLTQFCRQHNIATTSIEFRFYVTLADVLAMHEKAVKQLLSYHDTPVLDEYYQQIINSPLCTRIAHMLRSVVQDIPQIDCTTFFKNESLCSSFLDPLYKDVSAHHFLCIDQLLTEKKLLAEKPSYMKKRKIITAYDLELIDARILHEIYQHLGNKSIFVCAGGLHIANIKKMLPKLGFQLRQTIGKSIYDDLEHPDTAVYIGKYFQRFHNLSF